MQNIDAKFLTASQFRRLADIKDQIADLENEFNTIATTGTPVSMPEPAQFRNKTYVAGTGTHRKITRWTPERRAKFRRTMRLKREGKL
jgi:hypothetical protein